MSLLHTAMDMMRLDCWMAFIDLKDAYYLVLVKDSDRKFLRFRSGDTLWQFRVLPNGLACAPRFFTKLLSPPFAHVREKGIECFPYIDDTFVVADTFDKCQESVRVLEGLLEELGFMIHQEKSEFVPVKKLTFLGYCLDSEEMMVSLTEDKKEKFIRAASDLLRKNSPTIIEVSGLVGLMVAFSVTFNYGTAHLKGLEKEKGDASKLAAGNFDSRMSLSFEAREDICWCLRNIRQSGQTLRRPKPHLVVFTDASNEGWGAHVGSATAGGRWTAEELSDHINVLELRAILLELQSLYV